MSAWDILLPHRLLVNCSLRKASQTLRSHIDDYEIEYDREVERCEWEIEQARADKDKDFDKVKLSLIDELSKDSTLFENVQTELLEYVDLFLRRKCFCKIREAKILEKQALNEFRSFLTEQMRLIGDEIEILESRKDKLVAQAKVDDIVTLIGLSGCEITIDSNDDSRTLLTKVSELVDSCDLSNQLEKQALKKLRTVLQERVDLLPAIQYISWIIYQKIQLSRQLAGERRRITAERNDKINEIQEVIDNISTLSRSLDEQARAVREFWAVPITQLNMQRINLLRKKNEAVKEKHTVSERIERINKSHLSDSSYSKLWSRKKELRDYIIPELGDEIKSVTSELEQWVSRRQMLYSLCELNDVPLISDGKAQESDEYRIIDIRLGELYLVEKEAIKREEERCEQETVQIQQRRKEKAEALTAQIVQAEKRQAEKNALLSHASKQLSSSKSNDTRFILFKIISTDEVSKAKKELKEATSQKMKADTLLSSLRTELDKANEDFDRQLVACRPKPYRPTLSEIEEREKLECRRTELLNEQSRKKSTHKERRYDGSN